MSPIRIAILDLYEGEANEGMRCIKQIVDHFRLEHQLDLTYQIFDVRGKKEIADNTFDAYISSGGPGSPLTSEGSDWENNYFSLMDAIRKHNASSPFDRKHVFLICHSFQIYCRHYGYARVTKRKSTAFGVMPIHKTRAGKHEILFRHLEDPFYSVDSRDYQIVEPREEKIWSGGGHILCIEKERPHIKLERAVMAIRFDESFMGTQFHPEADSEGMYHYLIRNDKKEAVIGKYGERKYNEMLLYLNEPDKIKLTYKNILPEFLRIALKVKMNPVLL